MAAEKFVSVSEVLKKFGKDFVDALGKSLPPEKSATGKLRKSIRFQIKIYGQQYSFNLLMEDYYQYVDAGRAAGKGVPPEEIMKWLNISRVRSKLNRNPNSIFRKSKSGLKDYKIKGLAYAINKKIKDKGIKPTYFFTNVFEDGRIQQLQKDLREALKKDIIVSIKEI